MLVWKLEYIKKYQPKEAEVIEDIVLSLPRIRSRILVATSGNNDTTI